MMYMGDVWIEFLLVASYVGVCLSCSQGFSLNCSLFRARLCWGRGGSVAFEGFVLFAVGDCTL